MGANLTDSTLSTTHMEPREVHRVEQNHLTRVDLLSMWSILFYALHPVCSKIAVKNSATAIFLLQFILNQFLQLFGRMHTAVPYYSQLYRNTSPQAIDNPRFSIPPQTLLSAPVLFYTVFGKHDTWPQDAEPSVLDFL